MHELLIRMQMRPVVSQVGRLRPDLRRLVEYLLLLLLRTIVFLRKLKKRLNCRGRIRLLLRYQLVVMLERRLLLEVSDLVDHAVAVKLL